MMISGILTINNAVSLGYPFIEAILSVLPITDEVLINDGGSKDKTPFYLKKLQKTFPNKIRLFNKPHYAGDHWEAIDECLEFLIKKAKDDWIFEIQGDELWHEKDVLKIKKTIGMASKDGYNSIRTILHWTNFQGIDSYKYRNVRMVRKLDNLKSYDCGDDFNVGTGREPAQGFTSHNVPPELVTEFVCYNFSGIIFPDNALARERSHVTFLARKQEDRKKTLSQLESRPPLKQNPDPKIVKQLPALIQGLAGWDKYKVREELFDKKFLKKITGLTY